MRKGTFKCVGYEIDSVGECGGVAELTLASRPKVD